MLSARSFSKRATRKVLIDIPGKADISLTEDQENVHDPIHSWSRLLGGAKRGRDAPATMWDGRPRPSDCRKRIGN